jgi:transcriptional regulator with XRE-family HTH domain
VALHRPAPRPRAPFGLRLRLYRLAAEVTQAELAILAGVAWQSIARYEQQRGLPNRDTLARLARVLGPGLAQ